MITNMIMMMMMMIRMVLWHGQDPILHQGHGRQASPRAPINTGPAIIDENWDDVWSTMISVDAMMIMNVVIVVVMVMAMMMIMGT